MDFLRSYFKKVHFCQLTISRGHHFLVGATANPPNYDDWKWSDVINYRFLTTETTLKALYIFRRF